MARTIELKWKCGDCGTDGILGRHKRCPTCGSPREKGEMKMQGLDGGAAAPTVTDPKLLELAAAGADWFCAHCTAGNMGTGDRCASCGAPRYGTTAEELRTEQAAEAPEPVRAWRGFPARLAVMLGALFVLVLSSAWALSTHAVVGSVAGMEWAHTVTVERWTPTTVREWKHKASERAEVPPAHGKGEQAGLTLLPGTCRDEHYDDERYICGSHEECEDVYRSEQEQYSCTTTERYVCGETCSDNGNGFATCVDRYCTRSVPDTCTRSVRVFDHRSCRDVPDYCTRPIYRERCDYATQAWVAVARPSLSGSGKDTRWPEPALGPLDRGTRTASYQVTLSYTDDGETATRAETPATLDEYRSWSVGEPVTFHVRNLGGVARVERKEGENVTHD